MKKGDWVKIEFTGRVKATGEIFDLTSEEEAKKHGIHDPKKKYGPVLTILGAGMIMPGVDHELMKMNAGESREFDIKPEDALGPRRPELIKIFSISKFTHDKITPFPGMWVNIDGRNARIQTASSGRVRVDFNHPLAGKELSYRLKIDGEINDIHRRVEALLDYYGVEGKVTVTEKKVDIGLEKDINPIIKKLIEETLKKWCQGVDSVIFEAKKEKHGPQKAEEGGPAETAAGAGQQPEKDAEGK